MCIQLKPPFSRHKGIGVQFTDEPTGALDKKTGVEIMETLRSVNDIGKTLIVITHDEKIADMGDRILNIEDGRLI